MLNESMDGVERLEGLAKWKCIHMGEGRVLESAHHAVVSWQPGQEAVNLGGVLVRKVFDNMGNARSVVVPGARASHP
jgi:hypothetical protein